MRATNSSARALGGAARALPAALAAALLLARPLAPAPAPAGDPPPTRTLPAGLSGSGDAAPSPEQAAAVKDSFDWADGIISALAALAPPLAPVLPKAPQRGRLRRRRRKFALARRPPPFPVFVGRHLTLHRSTVFGLFNLTVAETGPRAFDLIVGSEEPAENIRIRDRRSRAVLVDRALDDERVFRVRVPGALSPDIVIEVSLAQAGGIDQASFPLLGDAQK